MEEVLELRVGAIYLSVLARGGDAAANGGALSDRINSGGIVAGKGKYYGVHRGYSMTSEIRKSNFKLLVSTFAFIFFCFWRCSC